MSLAVVRYNAGNTQSVRHALRRLGVDPIITDDPQALSSADRVIFPGVGEASSAMRYLRERGLDRVIDGPIDGERSMMLDDLAQVSAVDELHRQVVNAVALARVVGRDDVGVR